MGYMTPPLSFAERRFMVMEKKKSGIIFLMVCLCLVGCGGAGRKQKIENKDIARESQELPEQQKTSQTEWEGNVDENQKILADTEGEEEKVMGERMGEERERVEFLGSDRGRIQECYVFHEGEKVEILSSERKGFVQMVSEFIDGVRAKCDTALSLVDLKSPEDLAGISEAESGKYYIWFQFDQPPIDVFEFGENKKLKLNTSDKFIVELDKEKGEFLLNYNADVYEGNIVFHPCGAIGVQDEIESFIQKYEGWKAED